MEHWSADDYVKLIAAIVVGLTAIGAGIRWLVGFVVTRFLLSLDKNAAAVDACTKAVTDSSAAHNKALAEAAALYAKTISDTAAAQVEALHGLERVMYELRVEVRLLAGYRPPDESADGERPELTPVRGVPDTQHLTVLRKGTQKP